MPQLHIYNSSAELPRELASQIRSLLLAEWPGPEVDDTEEPLTAPALHPTYFILTAGNRLRSYARTIWATVAHQDQHFKLYGLGDVITVPKYRRKGYGSRIVQAATAQIWSDPKADAAVLLTKPELAALYQQSSWEYVPGLRVASDEYGGYEASDVFPLMLFLSAAARDARANFASHPLVLPGDEW
jgi:predicted GNAT family N-acyltransferase